MSASLSEQDYSFIRNLLEERTAIVLEKSKDYLIVSRLQLLKEKKQYADIQSILSKVKQEQCEQTIQEIINIMTTNETSFFRDIHPFTAIKESILPSLLNRMEKEKTINIWCGGCSTGQEPYSLAMLICEYFPQLLQQVKLNLLATDISTDALEQAIKGQYTSMEVSRGLPQPMLLKYFQQKDQYWVIKDHIRSLVQFKQFNLCDSWAEIPKLDLVFLRNVMIYFHENTRIRILNTLQDKLKIGSCFFIGGSEILPANSPYFKREFTSGSYYYTYQKEA